MSENVQYAELLRQSQLLPSELLIKGIVEFNAGAFFEQHETLETAWRNEPGPIRQLYQGILQIGVAYYQIQRGNYTGAMKMFERAARFLDIIPDVCQTVNIARLRLDAATAKAELERLGPERIAAFNAVLFKPVQTMTLDK
jgi:predicted metal-dependent hydrolase